MLFKTRVKDLDRKFSFHESISQGRGYSRDRSNDVMGRQSRLLRHAHLCLKATLLLECSTAIGSIHSGNVKIKFGMVLEILSFSTVILDVSGLQTKLLER